jgi:hypothetical protein
MKQQAELVFVEWGEYACQQKNTSGYNQVWCLADKKYETNQERQKR